MKIENADSIVAILRRSDLREPICLRPKRCQSKTLRRGDCMRSLVLRPPRWIGFVQLAKPALNTSIDRYADEQKAAAMLKVKQLHPIACAD
jgi:hypothetical protein